ncbi:MAG TPA: prepilin-type N-terminal cleavage/methylation domain-containing protein [Gaiellaceae bacterium]|nr:prepilin-type N-terminal cleavage/methylation domain-containing protein [Gaiellaceae bacterium]
MPPSLRRNEQGFGLVELLIALTILAVGILGVASAFISGMITLRRAGQAATATALADRQLERYRAVRYCAIYLDNTTIPGPGTQYWTGFSGTPFTAKTAGCAAPPAEATDAQQDVSGANTPDGRPYRIDTYIVETVPTSTPAVESRALKTVTVVVRDGRMLTKTLVRQTSTFDASLGK